jgi:hypothetical protein
MNLDDGALEDISGCAQLSEVYDVTQEEVDEFDKSFPTEGKERSGEPG